MNRSIPSRPQNVIDGLVIDCLGGLEAVKHAASEGISDEQYEKLFEIYVQEMPYGTAKARTGDPTEWIQKRIEDLASRLIQKEGYELPATSPLPHDPTM
jgi:hypothetical protein